MEAVTIVSGPLRMLAAEGLVTLVANSGAWVTRLSMEHLGDSVLERVGALAGEMEACTSVDAFIRADWEFH